MGNIPSSRAAISVNIRWAPLLAALLVVSEVLLTACGGSTAATGGEPAADPTVDTVSEEVAEEESPAGEEAVTRGKGGTLRLFYHQAPTILNPHLSQSNKDSNASRITYEPLASFDKDGVMVPFLAAEIPSLENGGIALDGTSVTWRLKESVQWSDSEPFTADDVLFTYEYVTNPEVGSTSTAAYAEIESVEVIDDHTVQVNFNQPTSAWFLPFVGPQGMIFPRHIFEEYSGPNASDAPPNLKPVGTGPYYVTDFVEEDILIIGGNAVSTVKIVYEANPFFREPDKPFFEYVELQGGGDINLAVLATKEGLVDFAWNIRVGEEALTDMESGGNAMAVVALGPFVERIMINFTDPNAETAGGERSSLQFPHPFLTDEAVRHALAVAIDREAIADSYGRSGRFTPNIATQPAYIDSPNTTYEYSPEQAATLLEEAGWVDSDNDGIREKDGVELRVLFQTSIEPLRQIAQEQVKQDLEAIGFEVELKTIDSGIFFGAPENTTDTRRQFYSDLEEFAFSPKSPDPAPYMAGWTCAEIAQQDDGWALSNWSRYCNPEYDALFEAALVELDPDRRAALFIQMNDLLIEDAAVIPLVHRAIISGASVDLKGIDFTAWDVETWNIKDWHK